MIASSGPASSTSQPCAPRLSASCSTFSATPPSGGSKASRILRSGMLVRPRAHPCAAEEGAQLVLALAAPPAAHRVDVHDPGVEGLLRIAGQAALRRRDGVGAPDPVARCRDAEREPQVLAD